MTQLGKIDWDLVKFQFEVVGYTLTELREEYGISDAVLSHMAKNWTPLPDDMRRELNFPKTGNFEDFTEDVLQQVQRETEAVSLVKQKGIFRGYVLLERLLLNKAIKIAQDLPDDSTSINHIHNLLKTLHTLISKNPVVNPVSEDVEGDGNSVQKVEVEFVDARTNQDQGAGQTSALSDEEETV